MANEEYKVYTIKTFVARLNQLARVMPDGINTVITSGDFEGNTLHQKHVIQIDKENNAIFLGFEMHEEPEIKLTKEELKAEFERQLEKERRIAQQFGLTE